MVKGIPVSEEEIQDYIVIDGKAYVQYFNAIRDYIIEHVDKFSTTSLIKAMETYSGVIEPEETDGEYRISQAIELYQFCKEHPNTNPPNENDFILGVLFACNFKYFTCNSCCYASADDEFSCIDSLLRTNEIDSVCWCGGWIGLIEIIEIDRTLKLLIPDFGVPQPDYHYARGEISARGINAFREFTVRKFRD